MFSDDLHALLREASEHGYERGNADGEIGGAADAADFLRPPAPSPS